MLQGAPLHQQMVACVNSMVVRVSATCGAPGHLYYMLAQSTQQRFRSCSHSCQEFPWECRRSGTQLCTQTLAIVAQDSHTASPFAVIVIHGQAARSFEYGHMERQSTFARLRQSCAWQVCTTQLPEIVDPITTEHK